MQWSPWEVLEINDVSTCAGYAHSQGRRCRNCLSSAKIGEARILLEHMSCYAISSDDVIHERLDVLAPRLLCAQWHEDQAKSLVATWKQRMLRFQRAQAVQKIQDLESTVEAITMRLEMSSLAVPQPHSSHVPVVTRAPNEDRRVRSGERTTAHSNPRASSIRQRFTTAHSNHTASSIRQRFTTAHSNTTASSTRQRFTTVYTNGCEPSVIQYDGNGTLPWSPESYGRASSSGLTPKPVVKTQAPEAKDESRTLEQAGSDCPICFDEFESKVDGEVGVSRCHGCLEKFHKSCIKAWIKQCEGTSVNTTCPCW